MGSGSGAGGEEARAWADVDAPDDWPVWVVVVKPGAMSKSSSARWGGKPVDADMALTAAL